VIPTGSSVGDSLLIANSECDAPEMAVLIWRTVDAPAGTAGGIIDAIRADTPSISIKGIKDALEDGAALAALGIGDDDQEAVEEAHVLIGNLAIASEYATECERLRAELAECREDAENWRAYAARKRAVIDAGMGKIILRDAARKGEGEV